MKQVFNMIYFLLLLCLERYALGSPTTAQPRGVKLQGRMDLGNDMADILQGLLRTFLSGDSKNDRTEININKLFSSVHDFLNNDIIQEINNATEIKLDNIKMKNLTQQRTIKPYIFNIKVDPPNLKKEIDKIKPKISKPKKEENKSKNKESKSKNEENKSNSNENKSKNKSKKDRNHDRKPSREADKEAEREKEEDKEALKVAKKEVVEKEAEKTNEEKKEPKEAQREKTLLEEIVGTHDSVHVYGKHHGKRQGLPLNNIKV